MTWELLQAQPGYALEFAGACVQATLEALTAQIVYDCIVGTRYQVRLQ